MSLTLKDHVIILPLTKKAFTSNLVIHLNQEITAKEVSCLSIHITCPSFFYAIFVSKFFFFF